MKKHFLFCIILALCIALSGCNNGDTTAYTDHKYSTLVSAIEAEDYPTAKSEFDSLLNKIMAEQESTENGNDSSAVTSESEALSDAKIKTVGITNKNFFDYFYIEKKNVPFVSKSGKTVNLSLPAYITLKKGYTIAPPSLGNETKIALEYSGDYTTRYCKSGNGEISEVGEPVEFQDDTPKADTLTITADRTSVYQNGIPGYTEGAREVNQVFDTFEITRVVGTLYLLED